MRISFCAGVNAKNSIPSPGRSCKYTGQSVRALPIRLIAVGKKRSPGVQLVVDEYIGKLKHYCAVDDVQVRSNPKNARDVKAQVEDEDMTVMNIIKSDDWVVMLDENGLDIRSEKMAELIGDAGNTGASRISFCIGGPYGHGEKMRERANVSIKLSSMVMDYSEGSKIPPLDQQFTVCLKGSGSMEGSYFAVRGNLSWSQTGIYNQSQFVSTELLLRIQRQVQLTVMTSCSAASEFRNFLYDGLRIKYRLKKK